jgi:hypothetical protein
VAVVLRREEKKGGRGDGRGGAREGEELGFGGGRERD